MKDDTSDTSATPRILPVFPLPNTVFFPATSLPLHVFEPRYRAMVRDVTAGEGLMVVALQEGDGFRDLGTVGRVRDLETLDDGRFNLRLEGLERVSLAEVRGNTPYRQVQVRSRPERMGTDDTKALAEARLELLATYGALCNVIRANEPFVLHQDLPFEVVVNTACASLPIEASLRQQLLAESSLLSRQRLTLDYLTTVIEAITRLGGSGGDDRWLN